MYGVMAFDEREVMFAAPAVEHTLRQRPAVRPSNAEAMQECERLCIADKSVILCR